MMEIGPDSKYYPVLVRLNELYAGRKKPETPEEQFEQYKEQIASLSVISVVAACHKYCRTDEERHQVFKRYEYFISKEARRRWDPEVYSIIEKIDEMLLEDGKYEELYFPEMFDIRMGWPDL